jgi:aryl-alcohol dehydrogenase-like predicted oxidoreductase
MMWALPTHGTPTSGRAAGPTEPAKDRMTINIPHTPLGQSKLSVTKITLGTMTFGQQVDEAHSHAILDHAVARGVNCLDAAEMYPVPPTAETYGDTERILGTWWAKAPSKRAQVVLATKAAGPSRGMPWVRPGTGDITPEAIEASCHASLKRLQTDVIDLYQIHWPNRSVPMFGGGYFDPKQDNASNASILSQLQAMDKLVKAGKVRTIGLSNETPWGVMQFVKLAEQHHLPRIVSVQNAYALTNRLPDNGLDEVMHREQVGLLAYSPLAFGVLTGKYDALGLNDATNAGRMAIFERFKQQRWARPEALAAAKRYNALAREHGLTPTRMALAWCYQNWRVASTIIGVTSLAQLDECIDAWDTVLAPELLQVIDQVRWELRDPAQ